MSVGKKNIVDKFCRYLETLDYLNKDKTQVIISCFGYTFLINHRLKLLNIKFFNIFFV